MSGRRGVSALPPASGEAAPASLQPLPRAARRGRVLVGLLLVVVSAAVVAWLLVSAGDRAEVLVIVRDVPVGASIAATDVAATRAGVEAPVRTIPAAQAHDVVGKIAAVDLRAGSLLSPSQLTSTLTPVQGQQIVAVGLKSGQLPAGSLRPGDQVLVVPTPAGGADGAAGGASPLGTEAAATVDRVSAPDADGSVVVNLLIAAESGPTVAKQAALGRVALVVTSRRP
ncbi:SAF domain-containing protein [Actinomadura sp. 3N407]|uniref:SAF domain-containing protein n=1 Tax=Actinomadura sp. 3N407 TaxID=3457423 RepID=UPI003FCEC957